MQNYLIETYVAGWKHHRDSVKKLKKNDPNRVEALSEPDNPVDPNAISLWFKGEKIGYIPSAIVTDYRNRPGAEYIVDWTSAGLSLNIYPNGVAAVVEDDGR